MSDIVQVLGCCSFRQGQKAPPYSESNRSFSKSRDIALQPTDLLPSKAS